MMISDNKKLLNSIREAAESLSDSIDAIYKDVSTDQFDFSREYNLHSSSSTIIRKLKRFAKQIGAKQKSKSKSTPTTPSLGEALRLLSIKENTKAISMLTELCNKGNPNASHQLGKIYSCGIKNKVGITEFYDPRKALINLLNGRDGGILESGYLLGVIYLKYGKTDEAKTTFYINHRKGCIRSSTELILMLQEEFILAEKGTKEAAIINTYIQGIKSDIKTNEHL